MRKILPRLWLSCQGSVNRGSKPWLEIPDEAEVKLRLKSGKQEVKNEVKLR